MNPLLHEILAAKHREVRLLRESVPPLRERERCLSVRDFRGSLGQGERVHLIAEIKYASPSLGRLRWGPEACVIAMGYQGAGASAISLITDRTFFLGDIHTHKRQICLWFITGHKCHLF